MSDMNSTFRRLRSFLLAMCLVWLPAGVVAQQGADDGSAEQSEPALRFTPGMARGFAGVYTREVLKSRYQLPDEKLEEAQELVARRFMQMAHKIDEPGRELIERFVEEQLAYHAAGNPGRFMPPIFGKEFADRILPIIPEIQELVRGMSQDVRPMLPMKQQLRMAGDLMAFKTGLDGFEATMKKWSSGEVTEYGDPFRDGGEIKKDEQGQSLRLKGAREDARNKVTKARAAEWQNYVEQFTKLYGLDPAQVATAESVLREFTEREERLRADPAWGERIYQNQLWARMSWELEGRTHPAVALLDDRATLNRASWNELDDDFKARLETIPTTSQRRAAEQKVAALLKDKGLQTPEVNP